MVLSSQHLAQHLPCDRYASIYRIEFRKEVCTEKKSVIVSIQTVLEAMGGESSKGEAGEVEAKLVHHGIMKDTRWQC